SGTMLIPAAIGLGSSLLGAGAAGKAAKQQQAALAQAAAGVNAATGQATNEVRQGTQQAVGLAQGGTTQALGYLDPYRAGGAADYGALRDAVGSEFTASPGYEFAVGEGINAIDRAASARGLLNSGARLQELTRYGTGVANQEYGNWLSRLQGLAQMGQGAAGASAGIAQQGGNTAAGLTAQGANTAAGYTMQGAQGVAGLTAQQGQARAAGTVGQTNALLGGVQQGLGLYNLMNPGAFGGMGSIPTAPAGNVGSNGMLFGGV
ncbi:MAG: hypothetical protein ACRC1H_05415, partial [Caldilineaceae bacterium]